MNFTRLRALVFNYLHTILYLIGNLLIILSVGLLTNFKVAILLLGFSFIVIALLINREGR